ncbi:hypothetical protein [Streptomyces sp. ALI-76-A]|uniref:hypothetical protein n=1 Tax=Streptomyces sp. ALI-76-A TaxID=3025736 RepID=UPI00256EC3A0|nr:hypothetical protein [Streptomyces sp. ALI-76-A]MDL5205677.1 hypothetical protein [Streptomyces sp. ALI-76-A]
MNVSPPVLAAALTVAALSAGSAHAAVPSAPGPTVRGAAHAPADISAAECVQGGGMIIVTADGQGANSYTVRCQGGTHDGETII